MKIRMHTTPNVEKPLNPCAGRVDRILARILGRCHFLRFGVRDRIIRQIHPPDSAVPEAFEVPFYGRRYAGDLSVFIDWSVFYYGAYAAEELRLMRDFTSPLRSPVVVDAGANIGHHTLFAATIASHVHAFEPFPPVADKVREKIARNKLGNVTLHPVGLGERAARLPYHPPSSNNTGTGSFHPSSSATPPLELSIVKGSEHLRECGVGHVDFLKIDVEGFEVAVLKGFDELLNHCRPVCFFEWSQSERGQDCTVGRDLFPDDYCFFEFQDRAIRAGIFQSSHYRLRRIGNNWPDGNLLAVPNEFADRHRHTIQALDKAL